MQYLTGRAALNIVCQLNTMGDWHSTSIDWNNCKYNDTEESIYGDWGLEEGNHPITNESIVKANHIRAILDIMEGTTTTSIDWLYGFHYDFLSTNEYDDILIEKVLMLKDNPRWPGINKLMSKTLPLKWRKALTENELL